MLLPLFFVITVNGVKNFAEDYKRKNSDNRENNTKCYLLDRTNYHDKNLDNNEKNDRLIKETYWKKIKPGNIVKIKKDENIPADLVLLYSSNKNGSAFTETKNLDGETNLKYRETIRIIFSYLKKIKNEKEIQYNLMKLKGTLECENPNPHLYEFKGILRLENSEFFDKSSNQDIHAQKMTSKKLFYRRNSLFNNCDQFLEKLPIYLRIFFKKVRMIVDFLILFFLKKIKLILI